MTRPPRRGLRLSPGLWALLGLLGVTAAVRLAPAGAVPRWLDLSAWGASLALGAVFAGVLVRRSERRTRAFHEAYRGTLDLISRLIDSVERFSENHSRRVAEYSVEVALALGLTDAEVEDVRVSAFLHDIGRLDVPAEALARAAGLTPEELDDVGVYGPAKGRVRRTLGGTLRHVVPIVTRHLERWDGTGRRALKGTDIPLGARIIAVADAYDTMVTDRPYRKGVTRDLALATLHEASGAQFDPRVIDVFLRLRGTDGAAADPAARAA